MGRFWSWVSASGLLGVGMVRLRSLYVATWSLDVVTLKSGVTICRYLSV